MIVMMGVSIRVPGEWTQMILREVDWPDDLPLAGIQIDVWDGRVGTTEGARSKDDAPDVHVVLDAESIDDREYLMHSLYSRGFGLFGDVAPLEDLFPGVTGRASGRLT